MADGLGEAIRRAREAAGITQRELADRVGVEKTRPTEWENSKTPPSIDQVRRIETALGLRAGKLFIEAGYIDPGTIEGVGAVEAALYRVGPDEVLPTARDALINLLRALVVDAGRS